MSQEQAAIQDAVELTSHSAAMASDRLVDALGNFQEVIGMAMLANLNTEVLQEVEGTLAQIEGQIEALTKTVNYGRGEFLKGLKPMELEVQWSDGSSEFPIKQEMLVHETNPEVYLIGNILMQGATRINYIEPVTLEEVDYASTGKITIGHEMMVGDEISPLRGTEGVLFINDGLLLGLVNGEDGPQVRPRAYNIIANRAAPLNYDEVVINCDIVLNKEESTITVSFDTDATPNMMSYTAKVSDWAQEVFTLEDATPAEIVVLLSKCCDARRDVMLEAIENNVA